MNHTGGTMNTIEFPVKFLKVDAVAARYQVNKSTIWRWLAAGHFPKPKKIAGSTRWAVSDLETWESKSGLSNGQYDDAV